MPGLPGSIQIADADEIELLVLQAHAYLLGLLLALVRQLASLVPLYDPLEVRKSLPVPHQPEVNGGCLRRLPPGRCHSRNPRYHFYI